MSQRAPMERLCLLLGASMKSQTHFFNVEGLENSMDCMFQLLDFSLEPLRFGG